MTDKYYFVIILLSGVYVQLHSSYHFCQLCCAGIGRANRCSLALVFCKGRTLCKGCLCFSS